MSRRRFGTPGNADLARRDPRRLSRGIRANADDLTFEAQNLGACQLFRSEVRRLTLEGKPPVGRQLDVLMRQSMLKCFMRMDSRSARAASSFAQTQGTRIIFDTLAEHRKSCKH